MSLLPLDPLAFSFLTTGAMQTDGSGFAGAGDRFSAPTPQQQPPFQGGGGGGPRMPTSFTIAGREFRLDPAALQRTFFCIGPVCLRSGYGIGLGVGCGAGIGRGFPVFKVSTSPGDSGGGPGIPYDMIQRLPGGYQLTQVLRQVLRQFPGATAGVGCGVGAGYGVGIGLQYGSGGRGVGGGP